MKTIVSHPTGNENVRAVIEGFADADILVNFYTTIALFPGTLFNYATNIGPLSEFGRRRFNSSISQITKTWPWRELGRLGASKFGNTGLIKHEQGVFCIDKVYQSLDKRVASDLTQAKNRGARAVYAYEDEAVFSFRQAKKLGLNCLYDLPIGYWRSARRLLEPERERWPEWNSTLTGFLDSETKLDRKDEELYLADQIFVASQFTAKTLQDFPESIAPIRVIPYGFPPVVSTREYVKSSNHLPLKLLFVGGLSQRKGIANLFTAVAAFGHHVDLTLVGRKSSENCHALNSALAKHKWIPSLSHEKILKLMRENDVLVFPSLFEGFGLVITEAMSQGTPVITTDRTAGPDFIENGRNGWIIEAGSTQALIECIGNLLINPKIIPEAGQLALETASRRPWAVYGRELAEAVAQF